MSGIYACLDSGPDVISRSLVHTVSVSFFVFTAPKEAERSHSIKLVETHALNKHHDVHKRTPYTRQPVCSFRSDVANIFCVWGG